MRKALSRASIAITLASWGCQTNQQKPTLPPPDPPLIQDTAMTPASGTTDPNVALATTAAEAWLALVDAEKYAESWRSSATIFKSAVTEATWSSAVTGARAPLGKIVSRQFKSAVLKTSLPGAPDGQYFVMQFDTRFENKAAAVETITPTKESDGTWRVSGYFIK